MIKDVPVYAIVVGGPAKVLKYRFTEEEIIGHESILEQWRETLKFNQDES